ncbi:GTPase domain-containing protein [Komagataeibacter sp. FNDCF1]|uniref:GTPase domain-containing protein n=1 Tax=Komagataeibacter sp. FNDCF1 TaxID=2878681 RepID=UPI001E3DB9E2|nr:GTPase domain-containing protein [Komagataeibacter sp. FNDCF1]MCE2565733.1 GTPase domain-containing protein [Komagataeibacter sp. FNDCF1]
MTDDLSALEKLAWNFSLIQIFGYKFDHIKLCVLGERGTGKTTLLHFIQSNSVPTNNSQTALTEKQKSFPRKIQDKLYDFKESVDVPGDKAFYNDWKESCETANWIVYLFRADEIMHNDERACNRMESDMSFISDILDRRKKKPEKILLIGTHCDCDSEYDLHKKISYQDQLGFVDKG